MEVFWRKGYQATSVRDLVAATGLQRGSLYCTFGDKHGLFVAALDLYTSVVLRRFQHLVSTSDDPVEAIREFVRHIGEECTQPEMVERGCMVGNTCTEVVATDPVAREHIHGFVSAIQGAMADALREGQRLGTFAPDRDPDAVAAFIQCCVQGLVVLAKSRPGIPVVRGTVHEILRTLD